jgi:hypothetical protein
MGEEQLKKVKLFQVWILSLMLVMMVSACSSAPEASTKENKGSASSKEVKITFLNSKGEIQQQLEEAAKTFKQDNPDITMEIIPVPAGQSPFEKASALYASGNPATISMLDPADVEKFKDRVLDLSNEKWKADAVEKSLNTIDFKVLASDSSITSLFWTRRLAAASILRRLKQPKTLKICLNKSKLPEKRLWSFRLWIGRSARTFSP